MSKILFLSTLALAVPVITLAHSNDASTGMMGNDWGMGSAWFFMILFWLIIIVGSIVLISFLIKQAKIQSNKGSALDILKQRYARGEIEEEEFKEKKKKLI